MGMEINRGRVRRYFRMVMSMMDNGWMIKLRVRASCKCRLGISMKGNGKVIKHMDKEGIDHRKELHILEAGKMIASKEMEKK
jgi:hypothetical protein